VAAIGGDAIGGNFAAVICQELRRHGEPQPALQLMIYPAVDVASETQSMTTYADAFPLSRDLMAWFMGHYLGPGDDPADPRLSPIKAPDLSGLAPAVIATAGFDPLVDQGEAYAKRLSAAGTPVAYRCYDALAHGFCVFASMVPAADVACREIAGLVREAMEGRLR
jgi:acetyl esterase/lipase